MLIIKKVKKLQMVSVTRRKLALTLIASLFVLSGCGSSEDNASVKKPSDSNGGSNSNKPGSETRFFATHYFAATLQLPLSELEKLFQIAWHEQNASLLLKTNDCQSLSVKEINPGKKEFTLNTDPKKCRDPKITKSSWSGQQIITVDYDDGLIKKIQKNLSDDFLVETKSPKRSHSNLSSIQIEKEASSQNTYSFSIQQKISSEFFDNKTPSDPRLASLIFNLEGQLLVSQTKKEIIGIRLTLADIKYAREDRNSNLTQSKLNLSVDSEADNNFLKLSCGQVEGRMKYSQSNFNKRSKSKDRTGHLIFSETQVAEASNLSTEIAPISCGASPTLFDNHGQLYIENLFRLFKPI